MFDSIIKDIKYELNRGNMVTKIILINICVFLVLLFSKVIIVALSGADESVYNHLISWVTLSDIKHLAYQPWSIITYSLIHPSIWQILFNMLLLYWFGQIAGDLIGDRRILPIYTYGAILGGFLAVIISSLIPGFQPGHFMIMGATAPVMAIIVAAATLAPEYSMRLVLIGNVRIKFIAMVLILFQILGIASKVVAGGALAGLGGAATGFLFIILLRRGIDLSAIFHRYNRSKPLIKRKPNKKSKIVSIFDSVKKYESSSNRQQKIPKEQQLDSILEKIKKNGKNSLNQDEIDFLDNISKQ